MKKVGVAILGLGVVGGGTYKMLTEHREFYQKTKCVPRMNVDSTGQGRIRRLWAVFSVWRRTLIVLWISFTV